MIANPAKAKSGNTRSTRPEFNRQLEPDPLFFVSSWRLSSTYNHIARIIAFHAQSAKTCEITDEQIAHESKRGSPNTNVNARNAMRRGGYITFQRRGNKPSLYELHNVHCVTEMGRSCKRKLLARISSWDITPSQH